LRVKLKYKITKTLATSGGKTPRIFNVAASSTRMNTFMLWEL